MVRGIGDRDGEGASQPLLRLLALVEQLDNLKAVRAGNGLPDPRELLVDASSRSGKRQRSSTTVNLRSDPSTENPPIRLLTPPEQVELLKPDKTGGYTTRIFVAQAIVAAVICGFVN